LLISLTPPLLPTFVDPTLIDAGIGFAALIVAAIAAQAGFAQGGGERGCGDGDGLGGGGGWGSVAVGCLSQFKHGTLKRFSVAVHHFDLLSVQEPMNAWRRNSGATGDFGLREAGGEERLQEIEYHAGNDSKR
jgi:hypothetical protein